MDLVQIGLVIVGLVSGLVIGFLLAKLKFSGQSEDGEKSKLSIALQVEQERYTRLTSDLESINKQLREEREKVILLNNRNAGLESDHRNLQERLQDQKKEIASLQEQFSAQFKNLANEIFDEKSKKFTDQNKTNLFDLLKPLGDKLTDFEKKVEATNKESLERNATLRQEILHLRELNNKMTQEAENLTKALKGDSRIQGDWGEIVLERILEQSGLEKDREYFLQESLKSEAGRRLRPDVIIRLPDSRNLVIDAKASLTAYERYMNTDDEEEKSAHLKDHLLSVKTHIKTLSEKSYQQLFDGGALDYVIMFVPIESAFALIVQHGGELYNEAHHKNIIIVSPATLIATLRTVASIWKHEYQNRNALEIARQGGALYDKFKSFVDDLVEVGKSLDKSKHQYQSAMNKLVVGKDNLIRKTERLKELGAKTTKVMDQKLIDRAEVPKTDRSDTLPEEQSNLFGG